MRRIDPIEAEEKFREKMASAGLVPPPGLDTSGKLVRVQVEGKRHGTKDGWYVFFADGAPAGAFGSWADQDGWQSWCAYDLEDLTPGEYAEHQERLKRAREARNAEAERARKQAQDAADEIWDAARPVEASHPYLDRKHVKAHGLRVHRDGRLVVPLRDGTGQIHSVEFIDADGQKRFLTGGRKAGCWFELGQPGDVICVAEGYATAASVYEATGYFTAVAFDCGNLAKVARALREKYPTAKIVICADDDQKTAGNPGVTEARKAARESGALVAIPDQPGDFNDQAVATGPCGVAENINRALAADNGPISAEDLFPLVFEEIKARKEGRSKTNLHTGIGSVDKLTGGLRRGYLTVVAGLPGAGKTSAAMGILAHNASHGVPCLMFSIEMDRLDIGIRFLSQHSGVEASRLFSEQKFSEDYMADKMAWSKLMDSSSELVQMLLTIDDRPVTLAQMTETAHKWFVDEVRAKAKETGLIGVDYLGLIRSDEGTDNRNREVAMLVQGVKLLARTLRVPVVLCAQLNRSSAKDGREPELCDLRDSGEIEAAADLVIFPYQWPRYRNMDGQIVLKPTTVEQQANHVEAVDMWLVRKNRNGPTGRAPVMWHPTTMLYTGISADEYDGPPRKDLE